METQMNYIVPVLDLPNPHTVDAVNKIALDLKIDFDFTLNGPSKSRPSVSNFRLDIKHRNLSTSIAEIMRTLGWRDLSQKSKIENREDILLFNKKNTLCCFYFLNK
jgi:hypothetical protein